MLLSLVFRAELVAQYANNVSEGFKVYGTYNTGVDEAKSLKQELGNKVKLFQVNFAERQQTLAFIDNLKSITFDAIVNNAGMIEFEDFDNFDFGIWDRTLEVKPHQHPSTPGHNCRAIYAQEY